MLPVCGGEIVEGERARAILGQALGGRGVFCSVPSEEAPEGTLGGAPIRGLSDLVQCRCGLRLNTSRELIEHVGGFVYPAAADGGWRGRPRRALPTSPAPRRRWPAPGQSQGRNP